MELRHEWKHEVGYGDMLALNSRLSAVMQKDIHTVNGRYEIRSIYFDNIEDKALREKIDGVNKREKFRIRYYNLDTSFIALEKKIKVNGLCGKEQAVLTLDEARIILNGELEQIAGIDKELVQELYRKMNSQGLRPKTIVDYTRIPFTYDPGEVRVTLDFNIRTGLFSTDFLNPDCITVPSGESPIILEVKWNEFLPSVIRDIVQIPSTHTSAFSKYAACRIYG